MLQKPIALNALTNANNLPGHSRFIMDIINLLKVKSKTVEVSDLISDFVKRGLVWIDNWDGYNIHNN